MRHTEKQGGSRSRRQGAAAQTADKLHKESAETMLLLEGKELIQSQTGKFRPYLWCGVSCVLLLLECGDELAYGR